jgi:hypothetical protein
LSTNTPRLRACSSSTRSPTLSPVFVPALYFMPLPLSLSPSLCHSPLPSLAPRISRALSRALRPPDLPVSPPFPRSTMTQAWRQVMGRDCGWLTAATARMYREDLKCQTMVPSLGGCRTTAAAAAAPAAPCSLFSLPPWHHFAASPCRLGCCRRACCAERGQDLAPRLCGGRL